MVAKGRQNRGEDRPLSKLRLNQIPAIHKMRREGASQREIAEAFGVSQSLISLVLRGEIWKGWTGASSW
jgi:predicted XRE-type DNA-binding protein